MIAIRALTGSEGSLTQVRATWLGAPERDSNRPVSADRTISVSSTRHAPTAG